MTSWCSGCLAAVLALAPSLAVAHGDWPPKHGGEMSVGGEITMEMVRGDATTLIYVEDHGEPVAVAGTRARLEIHRADGACEVLALQPHGANSLAAVPLDFQQGTRIFVTIEFDSGILMIGRFIKRFF